nr:hypothetical protein BaRGS_020469 [Batillaria attramentaria]
MGVERDGNKKPAVDEGYSRTKHKLPIMEMTFLQTSETGVANMTLGPLMCWGNDLNQDAVTMSGGTSSFLKFDLTQYPGILDKTIVLSFRTTQSNALLLYAHDHMSNFLQMELQQGNTIVFTYNENTAIVRDLTAACESGCKGNPCLNGGYCLEHYQNANFTCDCAESDFSGIHCEKDRLKASGNFANGQLHEMEYARDGTNMYLTLDGVKEASFVYPDYDLDKIDTILIGGLLPAQTDFEDTVNFTGCISSKMVDFSQLFATSSAVAEKAGDAELDDMTVIIAVFVIAGILVIALIIALLLFRKRKRHYSEKKEAEIELKQPLNSYQAVNSVQSSPVPNDHLAKLDEFSMITALLGPRATTNGDVPNNVNRHSQGSLAKPEETTEFVNPIFNKRKQRPASSISEVLEELERRQHAQAVGNTSSNEDIVGRPHGEGDLEWDPQADRTPLTYEDITFFNTPLLAPILDENEDSHVSSLALSEQNSHTEEKPDDSSPSADESHGNQNSLLDGNGDSGQNACVQNRIFSLMSYTASVISLAYITIDLHC